VVNEHSSHNAVDKKIEPHPVSAQAEIRARLKQPMLGLDYTRSAQLGSQSSKNCGFITVCVYDVDVPALKYPV
jgi:hypothetical protein